MVQLPSSGGEAAAGAVAMGAPSAADISRSEQMKRAQRDKGMPQQYPRIADGGM
jgi:hypothetical protein